MRRWAGWWRSGPSPDLSADADRLSRFLQEARAASALNHPNILTIHEVGDHQASRFLVSEFVEGETVRQRLKRGPMTLREILDIVTQTASALTAAHAAAIVHRDIKPDNLMLRPEARQSARLRCRDVLARGRRVRRREDDHGDPSRPDTG